MPKQIPTGILRDIRPLTGNYAFGLLLLAVLTLSQPRCLAAGDRARADFRGVPSDDGRAKIEQILARPVDVEFNEIPWVDAVQILCGHQGLQVAFDPPKSEQEDSGITISRQSHGASLKTVLRDVLASVQREFAIRDGRILVLGQQSDLRYSWRTYGVGDLVRAGISGSRLARLVSEIHYSEEDEGRDADDGPRVSFLGNYLLVRQTDAGHDNVVKLFSELRRYLLRRPLSASAARLENIWDQRLTLSGPRKTLSKVAQVLQQRLGLPVLFDKEALEAAGIELETELAIPGVELSLRSFLHHAFKSVPQPLTAILNGDELLVTTVESANEHLSVRVYDVRSISESHWLPPNAFPEIISKSVGDLSDWFSDDQIAHRMQVVAGLLVVRHSESVHLQIKDLLRKIRRVGALDPTTVPLTPSEIAEAKLWGLLERPVRLPRQRLTIKALNEWLSIQSGEAFSPDAGTLEAAAIDPIATTVDLDAERDSLSRAVDRALQPIVATLIVDHEMLVLTTIEKANDSPEIRVYPAWKHVRRTVSDQATEHTVMSWLEEAEDYDGDSQQVTVCHGFLLAKVRQPFQQFIVERLVHFDESPPANFAVESHPIANRLDEIWRPAARPFARSRINP